MNGHLSQRLRKLCVLLREEETKWSLKAKVRQVVEGDDNTQFFHMIANGKHRKNKKFLSNARNIKRLSWLAATCSFLDNLSTNPHINNFFWHSDDDQEVQNLNLELGLIAQNFRGLCVKK